MKDALRFLSGISVALLVSCSGSAKREASILIAAVDAFRRAESQQKEAEAKRVAAVACTDDRVCEAKRACVSALEPTAQALILKEQVERSVASIEGKTLALDSPEARGLPAKLDEAQRLLSDGRAKMAACDRRLAELQLQLGM